MNGPAWSSSLTARWTIGAYGLPLRLASLSLATTAETTSWDTTTHEVERWDQHEITTKPIQSAHCVPYSLRIGRREKAATGLRLRTVDEGDCKDLATELHLKLVDGHEVWQKLYEDRGARLKGLLQAPGLQQPKR
jgi:hypothetical protein